MLHVAVADTGLGIPADKQALIFQAFSQADTSTARRFGGTGLGLTISSQLVALMGGRLWVESAAGPGRDLLFHRDAPGATTGRSRRRRCARSASRGCPCWSSTTTPPTSRSWTRCCRGWRMRPSAVSDGADGAGRPGRVAARLPAGAARRADAGHGRLRRRRQDQGRRPARRRHHHDAVLGRPARRRGALPGAGHRRPISRSRSSSPSCSTRSSSRWARRPACRRRCRPAASSAAATSPRAWWCCWRKTTRSTRSWPSRSWSAAAVTWCWPETAGKPWRSGSASRSTWS